MSDGQIFSISAISSALSTAGGHDLLSLLSSAASRVRLLSFEARPIADAINSTALASLALSLWRGSTSALSGSAITPVNVAAPWNTLAAKSQAAANSSAIMSTASAKRLYAASIGPDGFLYKPEECEAPMIDTAQAFHASVATPQTPGIALAVTAIFEEIGKVP